jgi:aryl-alcohol dehydrogenase-like predicted oxidoreductase
VSLSIIGFGGLTLAGMDRDQAIALVEESVEWGVNYFDAAPSYGRGEAEELLGVALAPRRRDVFLASKTLARTRAGVLLDLEQSLRRLRSAQLDLYQFHAVNGLADAEALLAPGGAAEALLAARDQGLVRFLGFSSHSVPAALFLLQRFPFDSILFPVNFICCARGDFGPQVLAQARKSGVACIGLKSLAYATIPRGEARRFPNCWYRPIEDPALAMAALRFTLSENVTALIPPAQADLFRMAVKMVRAATPLTAGERDRLLAGAHGLKPILWARKRSGEGSV